jgi:hypothetical protein
MKSPSDTTQNTSGNTFTSRTTLSNSMLQAVLSSSNVVDNTSTITNTSSPESEAVRHERLRVTIDLALAVIESDDFDFIESLTTTQQRSPQ